MIDASRAGEVIESSTTRFVAQCYELHTPPPLGGLVKSKAGSLVIYGVVFDARTASIDPGRRPIARGQAEAEEADIYRSNPQLARLLRTDFEALVIGYGDETVHHYLPPVPAHIHSFVHLCAPEEVRAFSAGLGFLRILLAAQVPSGVDELIGACLRLASRAHADPRAFLVAGGRELAALLGAELPRLNTLLKRLT